MSTRSVMRHVKHVIRTHPQSEVTVTAYCLNAACGWTLAPTADLAAADEQMMAHAGKEGQGHRTFARTLEDVALASRLELNKGQQEAPPLPVHDEEPRHERAAH
ncbi:hypothetical protein ACH427_26365 [Streptomyces sp. NPDC020379]|uniref:DUF7848 domain-containing protein n=1 Tax=Streptomyces sp. NPDC020379 TaxID=3365071 RepID=UPI0037B487B2